jgi:uncharacterized protein (TIGR03083 family)
VATVLAEGAEAPRPEGPPTGSDPVAWYREGSARLLAALRETPNDQETWNWSAGPQVASFWTRRMAQETLVHRWDAENAAGLGADVDPLIAVDGIDELLDVFWRRYADSSDADPPGGTLHVHCTDVDGEWWAGFEDGAYELRRTHEKGDVAVRGPAADVLLVLWGRRPPATLERLGDPAVFDDWLERATV